MSYIVPMQKPVCQNCYFRVGRYCGIIESTEQIPVDPNRCPLIDIPTPHGDLVDRDKLVAEYDRQHKGPAGGARAIMLDAPAVIEAEDKT